MELKKIDKIVVIMFGLMGDVLMRTPVLKALKEIYPQSKITALCDGIGTTVLRNNPYVDDIISVNRRKLLSKLIAAYKVRAIACDLLIDLYNGGSSSNMTLISGARYRLGYKEQKHSSYYNILSNGIKNKSKSIYSYNEQIISILTPISDNIFSVKPIFPIGDEIKKSIAPSLEKKYILNLGSGGREKILDLNKYFLLVKYIYESYGYTPMVVCNPNQEYLQKELIDGFLKPSGTPYIQLHAMALEEIGALMLSAKFVVTPDTGLMHIAIACDSMVLGIFTYTNPYLVDFGYDKLVSVYEYFDATTLFRTQNITLEVLFKGVDTLMKKGKIEKICNDI